MYVINPELDAQENILAMMQSVASQDIVGDEFTIGLPVPNVPVDKLEMTNTEITLTAVADKGFLGQQRLRYRRLELGNTHGPAHTTFTLTPGQTREQIIEVIVAEHRLLWSEIAISGMTQLPIPGQSAVLTLSALMESYFYIGQVELTVVNPLP